MAVRRPMRSTKKKKVNRAKELNPDFGVSQKQWGQFELIFYNNISAN